MLSVVAQVVVVAQVLNPWCVCSVRSRLLERSAEHLLTAHHCRWVYAQRTPHNGGVLGSSMDAACFLVASTSVYQSLSLSAYI
eukprot:503713-Amphidinium_carterae.1